MLLSRTAEQGPRLLDKRWSKTLASAIVAKPHMCKESCGCKSSVDAQVFKDS